MVLYLESFPQGGEMEEGDWKGEVGAPEFSEQVESPNKTYLFHLR